MMLKLFFNVAVALTIVFGPFNCLGQDPGPSTQPPKDCKTMNIGCRDCTSMSVCIPGANEQIFKCSQPTPYCNNGVCTTTSSGADCPAEIGNFNCPAKEMDGVYPDATDCELYHICMEGKGYDYRCTAANSVYSPNTESCVRRGVANPCSKVDCGGVNGAWRPYPLDESIYFLCLNEKPAVASRCVEGSVFDKTTQMCTVKCTREGKFPDPMHENMFVECTSDIGTKYTQTVRSCPGIGDSKKTVFDPVSKECVIKQ